MDTTQKRALRKSRDRPTKRGPARFEVVGLVQDRELVRLLARKLAENDDEAARLRAEVERAVSDKPPRKGGVWAWLRRSPLVGTELDLSREEISPRNVEL